MVGEKPIVFYLIERIRREFEVEIAQTKVEVVIATSDEPDNHAFEKLVHGVKVWVKNIR